MRAALVLAGAATLAGCAGSAAPPPGEIGDAVARYACADGTRFTARFGRLDGRATLTFAGADRDDHDAYANDRGFRVVLGEQRVASGLWYAGGGWSLRGKGSDAVLTRPDGRASECRASSGDGNGGETV